MKAYLVRLTCNREIVGFFVAGDKETLLDLIDECAAPACCEYRRVSAGGIFWPGRKEMAVPHLSDDEDDETQPSRDFAFSEPWASALYHENGKWHEVVTMSEALTGYRGRKP